MKAGLGVIVTEGKTERYEGVRFHDLRHTCAALLIENHQHMEEVEGLPRPLEYPCHVGSVRAPVPARTRAARYALDNTFAETPSATLRDFSGTEPEVVNLRAVR